MARPSTYDYDLCIEICDKVAEGDHIFDILQSKDNYPSWSTFRKWKQEHEELSTLYVKSQQDKSEACTHKIKTIQDKLEKKEIDPASANVIIQTNKWLSSKFYPRMFGDRVDVTSDGEKMPSPTIVINQDGDKD